MPPSLTRHHPLARQRVPLPTIPARGIRRQAGATPRATALGLFALILALP
jgi:hypothetical protein